MPLITDDRPLPIVGSMSRTPRQRSAGHSLELRLNCPGVRSEPVRPWSCVAATVEVGHPQGLQHEGSREDVEGRGVRVQNASREAQFAVCSVAVDVLPASSVLTFFLDCRRHMLPVLGSNSEAKRRAAAVGDTHCRVCGDSTMVASGSRGRRCAEYRLLWPGVRCLHRSFARPVRIRAAIACAHAAARGC